MRRLDPRAGVQAGIYGSLATGQQHAAKLRVRLGNPQRQTRPGCYFGVQQLGVVTPHRLRSSVTTGLLAGLQQSRHAPRRTNTVDRARPALQGQLHAPLGQIPCVDELHRPFLPTRCQHLTSAIQSHGPISEAAGGVVRPYDQPRAQDGHPPGHGRCKGFLGAGLAATVAVDGRGQCCGFVKSLARCKPGINRNRGHKHIVLYHFAQRISRALQLLRRVATAIHHRIKLSALQRAEVAIAVALELFHRLSKWHITASAVEQRDLIASRQCGIHHMPAQKDRASQNQKSLCHCRPCAKAYKHLSIIGSLSSQPNSMRAFIDFAAIQAPKPQIPNGSPTPGKVLPAGSPALRVAFGQPVEVLVAHTLDQVKGVLQAVEARALQGQWCVGYLRYEAAPAFDRALAVHPATGPLAWFGVHDAPLPEIDGGPSTLLADGTRRATWQPGIPRTSFEAAMDRLHQAINDGEIYQANLTARNVGQLHVPPWELFSAMRQAQPGGFAAYIDTGDEQVLSVSPELFFDWHDGHVVTRPMKGTAPRGNTPEDDAALAQALRSSPKERAENVMIVDLIRNDLSRVAQPFSVAVDGLCRVQALSTVWQMVTDVHADTRPGTSLVDVFTALFPCGSVTGAPKVQAMRLIRELEDTDRAVYCGAVGVVRPGGSATFNVPIRTVLAQGERLRTGTGSGITSDAESAGEWQEWQHKQAYLTRASQSFSLLETLALQDGEFQKIDAHLARMAASATHFGFAWRPKAVQQTLSALCLLHPAAAWRVRLLLDASGAARAEAFALPTTPATVRLQLADRPLLQAGSEFVRHKTTRRAHYEEFAPTNTAVFDTVLWNTQGEVTECTRGNIALLLDGRWVTPAAQCGLLPGVGRAHWLGEGRVAEAVVHLNDLHRVKALAFVNCLRGWVDAVWDTPLAHNPPMSWDDGEHGALQPG